MIDATRSLLRKAPIDQVSGAYFGVEGKPEAPTEQLRNAMQLIQAITRFTAGEAEAFNKIAEILERPLRRFFQSKVGGGLEADDLIQETLIGVSKNAASFDPDKGGPFSWVMTIANRRLVDFRRAQARRHEVLMGDLCEVEQPNKVVIGCCSEALPSDEIASQRELTALRRRLVTEAIEALPRNQRNAFNLAYFEGMTQQSIADGAGNPVGTVKAWLRRGLTRLRGENPQLEDLLPE